MTNNKTSQDVSVPPAASPSPSTAQAAAPVRVVGIGASAGGLEALRELLEALPQSKELSYVIAQHVSPTHVSLLMNLLSPSTELAVQDLTDGQRPQSNTIYITPPNRDVVMREGRLRLTEPMHTIGPKPSVNHFFHSLAEDQGELAVGIVLSGTGSDGSAGLRAIKAAGGLTIAQDPDTAKYDGMPRSAVKTGQVDLILKPSDMGRMLERLVLQLPELPGMTGDGEGESVESDEYTQIGQLVRQFTTFRLSDYKPATVKRRIARRMGLLGIASLREYIEFLRKEKDEPQRLVRDTFISVTAFFRDTEPFHALERAIDELVRTRADHGVIRCWVPGCASGEEAYSIAMLLEEALRLHARGDLQYMVFASDLDEDALEQARSAMYPAVELDCVAKPLRDRYTEQVGTHSHVLKSIRNRMVFARQNLLEDPPFARLDLISCRNLLIYLNPPAQRRVFEVMHYALNPQGRLFLGRSESAESHKDLFVPLDSRARLYRRQEGLAAYPIPMAQALNRMQPTLPDGRRGAATQADGVGARAVQVLAERFAPPSLVVDDNDHIIHFQGQLKPFLEFPRGRAEMLLFDLVAPALRAELRALVYRCRRDLESVRSGAWAQRIDDRPHQVSVHLSPLEAGSGRLLLLSFLARESEERPDAGRSPASDREHLIITELEQELANTRSHLNLIVEELESSNEELQSLNEELQSTNEELQSTNEELQTSNEELQSTNEELLTVNEELQVKSTELEETASDLLNVKESLTFPVIVVDLQLKVTRANAACFWLVQVDTPLAQASLFAVQWRMEVPGLLALVRETLETGRPGRIERFAGAAGKTYRLEVMPKRRSDGLIDGAVLVFEDVTTQVAVERALQVSNERYELALRGTRDALWDWDLPGATLHLSPRLFEMLGHSEGELDLSNVSLLHHELAHPEDRERVAAALQAHLDDGRIFDLEYRLRRKSGEWLWIQCRGEAVRDARGQPVRMAGFVTDIAARKLAQLALEESLARSRTLLEAAPDAVLVIDERGSIEQCNAACETMFGYRRDELLGASINRLMPSHARERHDADVQGYVEGKASRVVGLGREVKGLGKDGREIDLYLSVGVQKLADGGRRFVGFIRDLTERVRSEAQLRLAASVFTSTLDGIVIVDATGRILQVNPAFTRITGYPAAEVEGRHCGEFRPQRMSEAIYCELGQAVREAGSWQGEVSHQHHDGRVQPLWISLSCVRDAEGRPERYIAVLYDITEQKLSQERIHHLAHFDVLTGLPNRFLFVDRLGHAIAQAQRVGRELALLFIDLDNFKQVNDTYGHPVGDQLLCQVAQRLGALTRAGDTVARLSGDEFTVLIEDARDGLALEATARKLLAGLAEPFEVKGGQLFVTASIGIATYPKDGGDIDTLLRFADLAMYRSKDAGRNQLHFFTQAMSELVEERMQLNRDLRRAMDAGELALHYQPVLRATSMQCVGVEALARWNHPELGWIPPAKFIPLAEDSGLILPLGEWVLREACTRLQAWAAAGMVLDFVSVNVSGRQVAKPGFVELVQRILNETGCPPQRVMLELTESYVMHESASSVPVLEELRQLGFGLAIDDFGTGYSSLAYLNRLPVTKLKLDQSFVRDIPADPNGVAIARSVLRLGEILGLEVVAEGVETAEQHEFIRAEGCSFSQGYLYSRPLPQPELEEFLRGHRAPVAAPA